MVKEFLKSIFRTWGRLFAYLILAILAYFIFSWFDLPNVKAENYSFDMYVLQIIDSNGNTSDVLGNSMASASYRGYGYNALPTNVSATQFASVNQGNYNVFIQFSILFPQHNYYQLPLKLYFNDYSADYLATCDGQESYNLDSTKYLPNVGTQAKFTYKCTKLNVNRNFPRLRLNVYSPTMANLYGYSIGFSIQKFTFTNLGDENESLIQNIDDNTNRIMQNDDQNTERQLDKMDELKGELSDTNDALTDESDANLSILTGIGDLMPSNTPITDIITLPLTILNAEINALSGTCSAWTINTGSLLGNHIWTIPCISPGNYLTGYSYGGYNLWELIDLMICLYMGYEILMLIIASYNSIANLEDTFNSLYVPRHKGYAMKHGEGRI